MAMGNRHCQRISRVRLQLLVKIEQYSDHMLNLSFLCHAASDHRALDLHRRVFEHWKIAIHCGTNRRPAGLTQLQRRIRILRHEHPLNRHFNRPKLGNHRPHAVQNPLQPRRKFASLDHHQRLVMHMHTTPRSINIHHANASALRTWVDA